MSTTPFVLSCMKCDAGDGIDSPEQATLQGWTNLDENEGPSWTWLGECPDCAWEEHIRDQRLAKRDSLRDLRDAKREQIEHDRYEAQADEAHAIAREQETDDDDLESDPA